MKIIIKNTEELEIMRKAGEILRTTQEELKAQIKAGISLLELDALAEKTIRKFKAEPSFKGYKGFPGTLCTMLNSEVVHGIPDERKIKEGDLLSVDCGVKFNGFHADAAFSVIVGGDEKNPARAEFSNIVREALLAGCRAAKVGNRTGDIGSAIEKVIVKNGYSICREYTGHGLGRELHEDPHLFNYGPGGQGERLVAGMTLAIEPIVASGSGKVKTLSDGWTVVTVDGRDACQWEHCGVVTVNGLEIFA
ncbi:type I methionyl aminopeptidase [Candidatus Gracilibacteria bacterium]|nr:type I methionyl aminopeptidase [Candidatus Gracilibacteria bacterium]